MHGFDRAWLFTAATSILAACAGLAVGTVHPPSPEPAEPSCLGRSVALLRPAGRLTK
jgi:hypothetical protein